MNAAAPLRRAKGQLVARVLLWGLLVGAAVAGRWPMFAATTAYLVLAYLELRGALGPPPPALSVLAGAAAVGAFCWVGISGRAGDLPWVLVGLLLVLLTLRILLNELRMAGVSGAVADISATTSAAGVVGLLGAHLLLVRAVPEWGFRGVVIFAAIAVAHAVASTLGGRVMRGMAIAPDFGPATWNSVAFGAAGAVVAGVVVGLTVVPPLDAGSGVALGAVLGLLLPAGTMAARALAQGSKTPWLPVIGSPFRTAGGLLFAVMAFYWMFRALSD